MSTSKARFQASTPHSTTTKNQTTKASAVSAASKRTGGGHGNPNASGFVGAPTKAGNVQVIFNGKILTPQSLIPRKTSHAHNNAKSDNDGINKNLIIKKSDIPSIDEIDAPDRNRLKRADSMEQSGVGKSFAQKKLGGNLVKSKTQVEEMCTVVLNETTTQTILSLPSFVKASDTRDIIQVDERNARYEETIKSHSNIDLFSSRPTQTMNLPQKNQNEMAAPNALRDIGSQSSAYDIADAINELNDVANDGEAAAAAAAGIGVGAEGEEVEGLSQSVRKFITDTVGVAMVTPGCLLDTKNVSRPLSHAEMAHLQHHKHKGGSKSKSQALSKSGFVSHGATTGASGEDIAQSAGGGVSGAGVSGADIAVPGQSNPSGDNSATGAVAGGGASKSRLPFTSGFQGGESNAEDSVASGQNSMASSHFTTEDSEQIMREAEIEKIMSSQLLLKRLQMVERAIQQNANHRQQLDYRDLPDIVPVSLVSNKKNTNIGDQLFGGTALGGAATGLNFAAAMGATKALGGETGEEGELTAAEKAQKMEDEMNEKNRKVKKLFSYSNVDLIQGRPVTAMVWNAVSTDLLAVGYGRTAVFNDVYTPGQALNEEAQGGLVLFWSLRNPDYPEKILRTPHPVTALDFSKQNPMVLAVGLLNGDVNIYDVRREGANWSVPVESSKGMTGGHSDPVWHLKWIIKGVERLETLVSISTDGRVLEWNLKKGLVVSTLMQLKKSGMGEGWISNSAAGLSLDFHPSDHTTYITGTEDGSIHRCSVSYSEQYLDTYDGHEGPVYQISFSSRWPSMFLSCSADWSMNLYHIKFKKPLLSMRGTGENFPINDISWCPDNSTVFACVTVDAKLQIWDLSVSSIDPVVTVDTALEEGGDAVPSEEEVDPEDADIIGQLDATGAPGSPLLGTRYTDRYDHSKEDDGVGTHAAPMAKLLKNLNTDSKKKSLTSVLFGERNPSVVVGDDKGTVTVYRIFDPVTITHLGPLQQYEKLKKAVLLQTDPESATQLEIADNNDDEKN